MKRRATAGVANVQQAAQLTLERWIPKTAAGDYKALCLLLWYYSEVIKQGELLTPKHAAFLSQALRSISQGGDPWKALMGRRRRKGERGGWPPPSDATDRACEVAELRRNGNTTRDEAIKKVAETWGVSFSEVLQNWKDHRRDITLGSSSGVVFYDGLGTQRRRRRRVAKS